MSVDDATGAAEQSWEWCKKVLEAEYELAQKVAGKVLGDPDMRALMQELGAQPAYAILVIVVQGMLEASASEEQAAVLAKAMLDLSKRCGDDWDELLGRPDTRARLRAGGLFFARGWAARHLWEQRNGADTAPEIKIPGPLARALGFHLAKKEIAEREQQRRDDEEVFRRAAEIERGDDGRLCGADEEENFDDDAR